MELWQQKERNRNRGNSIGTLGTASGNTNKHRNSGNELKGKLGTEIGTEGNVRNSSLMV